MFKSEYKNLMKQKDERIEYLEQELTTKNAMIEHVQKFINAAPEECTYGRWCKVCEHARTFHIPSGIFRNDDVIVCGRSEVCKNFVVRENVKEKE